MERNFLGISGLDSDKSPAFSTKTNPSSRRICLSHISYPGFQPQSVQRNCITESTGYQPLSSAHSSAFHEFLDERWQFTNQRQPLRRVAPPGDPSIYPGKTTPLTIFYAGTVHVYDGIPRDKVEPIMLMAAKEMRNLGDNEAMYMKHWTRTSSHTRDESEDQRTTRPPMDNREAHAVSSATIIPHVKLPSIPLARKASLARFLEKRKERMASASPYSVITELCGNNREN